MSGVWVFLGGGSGALCRWALSLWIVQPWATVVVNLLGSFALAYLAHPGSELDDTWKLALGTGFLGSFTTYSTYNLLLLVAIEEQDWVSAALQASVTIVGALLLGWLGWTLAARGA